MIMRHTIFVTGLVTTNSNIILDPSIIKNIEEPFKRRVSIDDGIRELKFFYTISKMSLSTDIKQVIQFAEKLGSQLVI